VRAIDRVVAEVLASFAPPPHLSFSNWTEKFVRLPARSSADPGAFVPWKYQRGILDAIGDPLIERVTVIKSARGGYTKSLAAAVCAYSSNAPCSIILLVPTDDDARGFAVDEIDPMFAESPTLAGLIPRGRLDGRNTLTIKSVLGGGSIKILAARSPRNLRRHDAKVLFVDEADAMEVIKSEGDPIDLAENRTIAHADRKIVIGSTPTEEGLSVVDKKYAESDQRVFEVPCPECGTFFELLWGHIFWPAGRPREAAARCPSCKASIEERFKVTMVEKGEWRATKPEVTGHAGFRFNALISQFHNNAWGKLAERFIRAKRAGPAELQVFVNTALGQVWRATVSAVDENHLMARTEPFAIRWDPEKSRWVESIPLEVLYITAGVDVQLDRLEVTFLGWTREDELYVLGHEVVRGETNATSTWDELDAMLKTQWQHPLGGRIGIEATAVDSGDGNRTQQVYDFCATRFGRRIVAIKGVPGTKPFLEASRSKKHGVRFWNIAVDQVKTELMTRAGMTERGPGWMHFSSSLDEEWFRQFTSERRKIEKYVRGRPKIEWVRQAGRAAEALDCTVYGYAIRRLVRFDFEARAAALAKTAPTKKSIGDIAKSLNQ